MIMRRRPLLRAAAVGGSAYLVGKRAGQRQADQQETQGASQYSGSGDQYGQGGQDSQGSQASQGGQASQGSQASQGGQASQGSQASQAQAAPAGAAASIPDQLNRLSALHDQGALTDAEFASAKSKLLGT